MLTDHSSRREFLRSAVMLAGAGVTAPLWAAMKYDRDGVMRYFREQASETDARVKAGIEANRNGRTVKREFHIGRRRVLSGGGSLRGSGDDHDRSRVV